MQVPIEEVYLASEERIREDYGDIEGKIKSIQNFGQLQPILVRPPNPDEEIGDSMFVVVDGGRRYIAISYLHRQEISIQNVDEGCIHVMQRGHEDKLYALELEFHANEDRKNFDWKEKAKYVNMIHQGHSEKDDEWSVMDTAELLEMHQDSIYKYLRLLEDEEVFNHEKVQTAATFRTAMKQADIIREHKKRERLLAHREKRREQKKKEYEEKKAEAEAKGEDAPEPPPEVQAVDDPEELAFSLIKNEDARTWLERFDEGTFDWFHWDPPYGGEQGGGAFGAHEDIEDTWEYARDLMMDVYPEIYRVLQPGRWLATWCHQTKAEWLKRLLQGHRQIFPEGDSTSICKFCEKPWPGQQEPDSLPNPCPESPFPFWTNFYPNIWYKQRGADGHEIKRFLTNDYETFVLAAKVTDEVDDPILSRSNRSNVFDFSMVARAERRHVMHKPPSLLAEVLSIISIPGELGGDCGVGSGSLVESAIKEGRNAVACELSQAYYLSAVEAVSKVIRDEAVKT